MESLTRIEKQELSLLKDCNILFSFETKLADMKQLINEIKIIADHEKH